MIYGNYLRNKYNNAAVKLADAEGVPCIMEYSKGKNMRNYEIYGNSVQGGTPSPATPIEVQSVGDLTTNLFNIADRTEIKPAFSAEANKQNFNNNVIIGIATNGYTSSGSIKDYTITENSLTFTGNAGYGIGFDFDVVAGEKYSVKCNADNPSNVIVAFVYYDSDGNYVNKDGGSVVTFKTTTIPSGVVKMVLIIRPGTLGTAINVSDIMLVNGAYTSDTMPEYEPYHKYKVPVTVCGKNLLPNSDWMSGSNNNGFNEKANVDYITEYTQNSISFNLTAWTGVSSPRFRKDSVKRIVFKVNQDAVYSDSAVNFFISIQAYDDNNTKTACKVIYSNVVADTEYVFDISALSANTWYANSTQFSFCILSRNNVINLMVYDIAYYADTDTTDYEPYHEPITTNIYLDEPLRKVGDYADYIDFKNQKVVRNIFKQSLNATSIYKKLNSVIRLGGRNESARQKYDMHMLSTIFNYHGGDWSGNTEYIFHHSNTNYNYYWSIYWNRLGLTYDGTNVYRTDDTSQTPLTDSEIVSIANEWLSTLSDKDKEIYMILDTPTEENISIPTLKTFKGTSIVSVDTFVLPSNIKTKYVIS